MQTIPKTFNSVRLAGFSLLLVGGLFTSSYAQAQYKPTGSDGVTASPRYRQQLAETKTRQQPVQPAAHMDCPQCKDVWVSRTNKDAKGAGSRAMSGNTATRVSKHLCESCQVDWKTVGAGKQKETIASHSCSALDSTTKNCCSPNSR